MIFLILLAGRKRNRDDDEDIKDGKKINDFTSSASGYTPGKTYTSGGFSSGDEIGMFEDFGNASEDDIHSIPSMSSSDRSLDRSLGQHSAASETPSLDISKTIGNIENALREMNEALGEKDYGAVSKIAEEISSNYDELSSLSSYNSSLMAIDQNLSYLLPPLNTSQEPLNESEQNRRRNLDQLIAAGDWDAVAAHAATYEESDTSTRVSNNGKQTIDISENKRSFLDYVLGRQNNMSKTASNAISDSEESSGGSSVAGSWLNWRNTPIAASSSSRSPDEAVLGITSLASLGPASSEQGDISNNLSFISTMSSTTDTEVQQSPPSPLSFSTPVSSDDEAGKKKRSSIESLSMPAEPLVIANSDDEISMATPESLTKEIGKNVSGISIGTGIIGAAALAIGANKEPKAQKPDHTVSSKPNKKATSSPTPPPNRFLKGLFMTPMGKLAHDDRNDSDNNTDDVDVAKVSNRTSTSPSSTDKNSNIVISLKSPEEPPTPAPKPPLSQNFGGVASSTDASSYVRTLPLSPMRKKPSIENYPEISSPGDGSKDSSFVKRMVQLTNKKTENSPFITPNDTQKTDVEFKYVGHTRIVMKKDSPKAKQKELKNSPVKKGSPTKFGLPMVTPTPKAKAEGKRLFSSKRSDGGSVSSRSTVSSKKRKWRGRLKRFSSSLTSVGRSSKQQDSEMISQFPSNMDIEFSSEMDLARVSHIPAPRVEQRKKKDYKKELGEARSTLRPILNKRESMMAGNNSFEMLPENEFEMSIPQQIVEFSSESDPSDEVELGEASISLKDHLDRAIESGDWEAVEAHATKIMTIDSDNSISSRSHSTLTSESMLSSADSIAHSLLSNTSVSVDDEKIRTLESLIEADDWKGLVNTMQIYKSERESSEASTRKSESISEKSSEKNYIDSSLALLKKTKNI